MDRYAGLALCNGAGKTRGRFTLAEMITGILLARILSCSDSGSALRTMEQIADV